MCSVHADGTCSVGWLPFLCAFVVALLTATSYLELVTEYPRAVGAAVFKRKTKEFDPSHLDPSGPVN